MKFYHKQQRKLQISFKEQWPKEQNKLELSSNKQEQWRWENWNT
jgi:hypothetical protein